MNMFEALRIAYCAPDNVIGLAYNLKSRVVENACDELYITETREISEKLFKELCRKLSENSISYTAHKNIKEIRCNNKRIIIRNFDSLDEYSFVGYKFKSVNFVGDEVSNYEIFKEINDLLKKLDDLIKKKEKQKENKQLKEENQELKKKIKQIIEYAYGTDMLVSEYEQLCKIAKENQKNE